ncbi:V-type ATP synthase subunit D [Aromatoleum toluclasticum]|uniref:V-type ATP synthase subunit D n=1 Tax=Aromatoleum toluclasticum TaxID=92003 RepID=UPI001D18D17F|nr:V-type ATP synthase subunit D [Aromatoleum toluclasticum]MCC4115958.1 V-type ATP synthase subunit D [Aromatoleum toluclasticum]
MSEGAPTRSRLIALLQEQHAMQEGYVFLDEKCLILAGAMLRELERHDALRAAFDATHAAAVEALRDAIARHGLEGLSVYPGAGEGAVTVAQSQTSLIGIALKRCELVVATKLAGREAEFPSPEAEACREAFLSLASAAAALAASVGNLVRLQHEYRRTARRVASLHDVVLPELEREVKSITGQLEELERDEALWVRRCRGEA